MFPKKFTYLWQRQKPVWINNYWLDFHHHSHFTFGVNDSFRSVVHDLYWPILAILPNRKICVLFDDNVLVSTEYAYFTTKMYWSAHVGTQENGCLSLNNISHDSYSYRYRKIKLSLVFIVIWVRNSKILMSLVYIAIKCMHLCESPEFWVKVRI